MQLTPDGWLITEVAPGIDLESQILAFMDFTPAISPDLKVIPAAIYTGNF